MRDWQETSKRIEKDLGETSKRLMVRYDTSEKLVRDW